MSEKTVNARIKHLNKTSEELATQNPLLLEGEVCYVTDLNGRYKIGDGINTFDNLPFAIPINENEYWKQDGYGTFANGKVKINAEGVYVYPDETTIQGQAIVKIKGDRIDFFDNYPDRSDGASVMHLTPEEVIIGGGDRLKTIKLDVTDQVYISNAMLYGAGTLNFHRRNESHIIGPIETGFGSVTISHPDSQNKICLSVEGIGDCSLDLGSSFSFNVNGSGGKIWYKTDEVLQLKDYSTKIRNLQATNIDLNHDDINTEAVSWNFRNKNLKTDGLSIYAFSEAGNLSDAYCGLKYVYDGEMKNEFDIIHILSSATAPTIDINASHLTLKGYGTSPDGDRLPIINFILNSFNNKIDYTIQAKEEGLRVCDSLILDKEDATFSHKTIHTLTAVIQGQGSSTFGGEPSFTIDGSTGDITCQHISSAAADYAKYFEWLDGNQENEDRVGRFVTLDGNKIKYAAEGDTFILGIVSACPSFVDNSAELEWQGKYLKDIFGRYLLSEETGEKVINPEYDENRGYVPRSKRKEYSPIALKGKVVVIDDGTCIPNSYAQPTYEGGIATYCSAENGFRVLRRIDENHVEVLVY